MEFTRRDLGKIAIASVPLSRAFAAKMIDSNFGGVQIGAITYSFNRIARPDPGAIIKAYVEIGLGECELMANHCEALAGAPEMPMFRRGGGGGAGPAPRAPAPGGGPRAAARRRAGGSCRCSAGAAGAGQAARPAPRRRVERPGQRLKARRDKRAPGEVAAAAGRR